MFHKNQNPGRNFFSPWRGRPALVSRGRPDGCITAMAPFGGRVRTTLPFGVPRLRGSKTVRIAFDIPGLPGEEPAAPEDFWTRLKAELRTGFAHPNAPAGRHRRALRPRTQAHMHPVPASWGCRGTRRSTDAGAERRTGRAGILSGRTAAATAGASRVRPKRSCRGDLSLSASSMIGVLCTRGWRPAASASDHGSRVTSHGIPLYTLSARFYNERADSERRSLG